SPLFVRTSTNEDILSGQNQVSFQAREFSLDLLLVVAGYSSRVEPGSSSFPNPEPGLHLGSSEVLRRLVLCCPWPVICLTSRSRRPGGPTLRSVPARPYSHMPIKTGKRRNTNEGIFGSSPVIAG